MKKRIVITGLMVMVLTLLAFPTMAGAETTWIVDDDGGTGVDFTTIQAAVDAAGTGDTIIVHDGTYVENVDVDKIIIDHGVAAMAVGVTGANKTDYHVQDVVPGRDFPLAGDNVVVADIRNAVEGDSYNGKKLHFRRGIEVGQVFKLGTKYSVKLGAKFLDESGVEKPCLMGCYGIGINRIIASAIETSSDDDGILWPVSIAPFEVLVTPVNQDDEKVAAAAEDIYGKLLAGGVEVLLDDRDVRGGVKFKDADLIGIPVRVTVGRKSVAEGKVEIKLRGESESRKVPIAEAARTATEMVGSLKAQLNS